ncbi:MAG TPA: peptidylprolyl isomerase [Vicinamibacterales bacterium]|nr:peptidylprolyl isomerase [Vicinamibacterales bacterium]
MVLSLAVAVVVAGWLGLSSGRVDGVAGGTALQETPAPAPAQPPKPAPGNPVAVISTTLGEITVELFKDKAPVSVENFLQYARDGFYSGTIFHRVVPGYVIQGGGFTAKMEEKPTRPPILNEATNGLSNLRGTLAMARTRALRSATSQFFINLSDNRKLDHRSYSPEEFGYAVFGRVLSGLEVVDRIAALPTHDVGPFSDVPVSPVVIQAVTVKP